MKNLSALVFALLLAQYSKAYERGLTNHFVEWLHDVAGYEPYNFNRTEFFGGSFGGKENDYTPIRRRPVVFVHGTAGRMIGDCEMTNGFRHTIEYFLSKGYTKAELYGSMWGFGDVDHMFQHYHQGEWILQIRRFIDAVLEYTNATEIDVIAHSMGVTLSYRALQGGWMKHYNKRGFLGSNTDHFYIGDPIGSKVQSYIAITGGLYGSPLCLPGDNAQRWKICDNNLGFWPGRSGQLSDASQFIQEIHSIQERPAKNLYSILALTDVILPPILHGKFTGEPPGLNSSYVYNHTFYDHQGARDNTTNLQYNLLQHNSQHQTLLSEDQLCFFM